MPKYKERKKKNHRPNKCLYFDLWWKIYINQNKQTENISLQTQLKMYRKRNLQFVSAHHNNTTIEWYLFLIFALAHPSFFRFLSFQSVFEITQWWNQVRYWLLAKFRWHLCPKEWIELFVRNTNIVYGQKNSILLWCIFRRYESSYAVMGANRTLSDLNGGNDRCIHFSSPVLYPLSPSQIIPHCDCGSNIVWKMNQE